MIFNRRSSPERRNTSRKGRMDADFLKVRGEREERLGEGGTMMEEKILEGLDSEFKLWRNATGGGEK